LDVDDPAVRQEDWAHLRGWTGKWFDSPEHLPISFTYAAEHVHGIPANWSPRVHRRRTTSTVVETEFRGRHPQGALEVRLELITYLEYPVIEWTAWFANAEEQPSETLADVLALDAGLAGEEPILQYCNGDFNSEDGYSWQARPLPPGEGVEQSPYLGRPCDQAFPYFRLTFRGGGTSLAVGWPGQWRAIFTGRAAGVDAQVGQQEVRLRLKPGEQIRTPRVTLLGWAGDEERAINLWRRWYLDHVMPRPGGRPMPTLLSAAGTDDGPGDEFTGATESNQLVYQDRFAEHGIGYDIWWVDAGWYDCKDRAKNGEVDWCVTGTWAADQERFPRGLAPVSANAASHGARLLLWFEPERVFAGTALQAEHPQWVLERPTPPIPEKVRRWWRARTSGLLDLSDEECRSMLTELVSGLIDEYGIGVYRQDFNISPLDFWQINDTGGAEERTGATENHHQQGYLAFWDELLERHPGLIIDSCASGGRRNDLETMRRSVPFHYSDYGYGLHPIKVDFQRTLFEWLPYFKESCLSWDVADARAEGLSASEQDSYAFHCSMAPMLALGVDIRRVDEYDLGVVQQMISVWRHAADLLLNGDYYALTPPGRRGSEWVGRQFCSRDASRGLVQAIRHSHSPDAVQTLYPRRIDPDAEYDLVEAESGEHRQVSGAALKADGLIFEIPPRNGSIWFYECSA
jgi:alpha-galactosidase